MSNRIRCRRFLRFSLAAFFFAMTCTAGYFGGYRGGYESGVRQQFDDTISVVSYDIGDLHGDDFSAQAMTRTADELIALIKTVNPDGWSHPYVIDGIEISPDCAKLKITNYGHIHRQIEDVLAQVRELRQ